MRRALPLLALLACGDAPPAPDAAPSGSDATAPVQVEARVEGGRAQTFVVTVIAPRDTSWGLQPLAPEGLTLGDEERRTESLGDREVTTIRTPFQGAPGRYVLGPACVDVLGADEPVCALPVYVDLGETPDRSEMVEIVEPSRVWPMPPWWALLGGLAGAGGLVLVVRTLSRRRPEPVVAEVPAEPPHVVAVRRWEALRDDASLSEFERAQGLSEVFRAYVEAVLRFPARSFTTTETLDQLEAMDALPRVNIQRARRLLRATDRVKYAESRPGSKFFPELEGDLHGFIEDTRPRVWGQDEAGASEEVR